MAYRFAGNQHVEFSSGGLGGYTSGPMTYACLVKRNAISSWQWLGGIVTSGDVYRHVWMEFTPANLLELYNNAAGEAQDSASAYSSTTAWYILAVTWPGTAATNARFHVWDGTTWAHAVSSSAVASTLPVYGATDKIITGEDHLTGGTDDLSADMVCEGFKKSVLSDIALEALTTTTFSSWTGIAWDWLVGFETISTLSDRTVGGGNETARVGSPTLVSDPPGWSWALSSPSITADLSAFPKYLLRTT